jgi:EAL domain-containing protein (putative c-di-GMP-specific phosphodiesterase class I)
MPIDILKIDMGLTRNIHSDKKRKAVIQSLVGLCAKFNITLIAEGVETEEDREVLAEIGVTNLQGYLYGELNMSH